MEKLSILFVCMGNICRSPTAHGVFEKLVHEKNFHDRIKIDSAGTHAYHVGDAPDQRSQRAALKRGVDLAPLKARRVKTADFQKFDYILAMDKSNLHYLEAMCPNEFTQKLHLFLVFAEQLMESEVPDPYYGGPNGFERVLDLIEMGSEGLMRHIIREHFTT